MLGRMTCNFITDSGEFQENNEEQILTSNNKQKIPEKPVEGKFHYILPRPPLNIINQHNFPLIPPPMVVPPKNSRT
ncbi:uncharacterized protein OCT59_023353 [Rhizophagus irregularis]|nr:hypothetical protein OCT59_023353 [Rhizophagus irregularis]